MKDWLSIGEFSKQTGFSNKALRIYEEKDLLVPHARSESQYRYYSISQLGIARSIQQYKDLGFSLDEIKTLLSVSGGGSLKALVEKRLLEARKVATQTHSQIVNLESILTSLNQGESLTTEQRRDVMENIFETSIENIKRRGVLPQENDVALLSREIDNMSEALKKTLPELKGLLQFAKKNNVLLGPGRATTLASLVLYGEGYTPVYPARFNLLPELFSNSKQIWLDVEFSNYQEVGALCDGIYEKTGIRVVAFRSPSLDIFKDLQNKIGPVNFDNFRDDDPLILEAPRRLGLRGLQDFDWNENFEAFRSMTPELKKKFGIDIGFLTEWLHRNGMHGPEDFINISCLFYVGGENALIEYEKALSSSALVRPGLENTRGILIYREDWIRLFARATGVSILEANEVQRALSKGEKNEHSAKMNLIGDPVLRSLLEEKGKRLFLKAHMVSAWWHYKRTAVLKTLWTDEYLRTIDRWEQKNGMIWQEFGYQKESGEYYLKA